MRYFLCIQTLLLYVLPLMVAHHALAGGGYRPPEMDYNDAVERRMAGAWLSCAPGPIRVAEERSDVIENEALFAPLLGDTAVGLRGIADVEGMTHRIFEGRSPHLVLFVEGAAGFPIVDHPVLSAMTALAGNHRLALEYQATVLDDGAVLFGFVVFKRFPTLELCWEIHPYESVASAGGLWLHPFADLADVERLEEHGDRATLVLSEGAAQRVDRLSETHGHRTYHLRGSGISGEDDLGVYTWIPGVRSVPGVPAAFVGVLPGAEGEEHEKLTLESLYALSEVHGAARALVQSELGRPTGESWTIAEGAPHFTEPFFVWAVHAPVDGGEGAQAPWIQAGASASRRWLSLSPVGSRLVTAAVPRHWSLSLAGGAQLTPRPAENESEAAEERAFGALLRENLGREIALMLRGKAVGVFTAAGVSPESLALSQWVDGAATQVAADWQAAGMGDITPPAPIEASAAPQETDDLFQVRLMAEPQDRKLIPVTHFRAPGASGDVRVAVQNDIILDGRAVLGAQLQSKSDTVYLRLILTPEGREALDGICFSNMGKQLAIVFDGRLLCAPTIDDWEHFELAFKGMDADWPEVAKDLAAYLGAVPSESPEAAL